jgi:hypothetical protein
MSKNREGESAEAPDDAGLGEIVRRHLHFHAIADGEPDEALAHLAGNGREHLMLVRQFHPEHRARQHSEDAPFHFNVLFHEKTPGVAAPTRL